MKKILSFITLATVSGIACAHPGHAETGLASGLLHPIGGLDHILAMLAVGMWAASFEGKARWAIPAAFVGMMTIGFMLGANGVEFALTEQAIAASVLVIGLAAAWLARIPTVAAAAIVAAFALFHGLAHGAEMHGSATAYAAGFIISTIALHVAGFFTGKALSRHVWLNRMVGSAIALTGLGLMLA